MNNYRSKFREHLQKKGMKFTPERKTILNEVFSLHSHFDVEKLYERLRRYAKNISMATIYRTLPLLVESGLIKEIFRLEGKISYEHIFGHRHHDHMVCIRCEGVIEFQEEKIEQLQDKICEKHQFMPLEHRLGIRGYCKKCSKGG